MFSCGVLVSSLYDSAKYGPGNGMPLASLPGVQGSAQEIREMIFSILFSVLGGCNIGM